MIFGSDGDMIIQGGPTVISRLVGVIGDMNRFAPRHRQNREPACPSLIWWFVLLIYCDIDRCGVAEVA